MKNNRPPAPGGYSTKSRHRPLTDEQRHRIANLLDRSPHALKLTNLLLKVLCFSFCLRADILQDFGVWCGAFAGKLLNPDQKSHRGTIAILADQSRLQSGMTLMALYLYGQYARVVATRTNTPTLLQKSILRNRQNFLVRLGVFFAGAIDETRPKVPGRLTALTRELTRSIIMPIPSVTPWVVVEWFCFAEWAATGVAAPKSIDATYKIFVEKRTPAWVDLQQQGMEQIKGAFRLAR